MSVSPGAARSAATHEQAPRSRCERWCARRSEHRVQRQLQQGDRSTVISSSIRINGNNSH